MLSSCADGTYSDKEEKAPTVRPSPKGQRYTLIVYCESQANQFYLATQLKNNWVRAAKIKSKWKAEKRREGFETTNGRQPQTSVTNDNQLASERGESPHEDSESSDPDEQTEQIQAGSSRPDPQPAESLRELSKKAYSPNSLHNHRADPLHRRKGESSSNRDVPSRGRSRGQPNMKLRMNAMLEKIKQDLT